MLIQARAEDRVTADEPLYNFRRGGTDSAGSSASAPPLRERAEAALAARVARLGDAALDGTRMAPVIVAGMTWLMRARFRRCAARTVFGRAVRATLVMTVRTAAGRAHYRVDVRDERCTVTRTWNDASLPRADAGIELSLPALLRISTGAAHPALVIAHGEARVWGDAFLLARICPMFGLPTRSLVPT